MAEQDLGELTREQGLRSVWPHEANDFTPWLGRNMNLLSEALGIDDVEVLGLEERVGSFSLDILGREAGTGRTVIVENQLEPTDHGHLGQLLTYAAGLDAKIVVWVSPEVRDEHREAVHWLNAQTGDDVGFFAVQVELWRIGESPLAPRFSVLAEPSDFRKDLQRAATRSDEGQAGFRDFNDDLLRRLRASSPAFPAPRARRRQYITFPRIGHADFRLATTFQREQFEVEMVIQTRSRAANEAAFDQLFEDRDAVNAEVGLPLEWDRHNHDRVSSRVFAGRPGTIDSPPEDLEEFKKWAVELLPKFRSAFEPRIAALDLEALTTEAAANEEAAP